MLILGGQGQQHAVAGSRQQRCALLSGAVSIPAGPQGKRSHAWHSALLQMYVARSCAQRYGEQGHQLLTVLQVKAVHSAPPALPGGATRSSPQPCATQQLCRTTTTTH